MQLNRSCPFLCLFCSPFQFITLLEAVNASGGIQHAALSGEKGMAFAAQLNLEQLPGGADSKGITAGTNYLGIIIILRVNLILHVA